MKKITWDHEKALKLRNDNSRGHIGFEDCVIAISENRSARLKALALANGIPYQALMALT